MKREMLLQIHLNQIDLNQAVVVAAAAAAVVVVVVVAVTVVVEEVVEKIGTMKSILMMMREMKKV